MRSAAHLTSRRHVACGGCGYDLFGLHADGRCPECQTPLADTRVGGKLWRAYPAWLTEQIAGCAALLAGVAVWLALAWAVEDAPRPGAAVPVRPETHGGLSPLNLAGFAGWLVAPLLLATRPRPQPLAHDSFTRAALRIATAAAFVVAVASCAATHFKTRADAGEDWLVLAYAGVSATFVLGAARLATIARDLPDDSATPAAWAARVTALWLAVAFAASWAVEVAWFVDPTAFSHWWTANSVVPHLPTLDVARDAGLVALALLAGWVALRLADARDMARALNVAETRRERRGRAVTNLAAVFTRTPARPALLSRRPSHGE